MVIFLWGMFVFNLLASVTFYLIFYRKRKGFTFHMGMNLAMIGGGVIGLAYAILLIFLFPSSYVLVTIMSTFLAMITGAFFGGLVNDQFLLTGVVSGVMSGLMGPMIGEMMINPLCSIMRQTVDMVDGQIILVLFSSFLVLLSLYLVHFLHPKEA